MMIYIDNEFKCHVSPGEGLLPAETDLLDGMCTEYIEGFRYIPTGESWTREDGEVFHGEMLAPWKPWGELGVAQLDYQREQQKALTANLLALDQEYQKGVNSL